MRIRPARIPFASNVSGDFHSPKIEPGYWSNHVRQAVLFHAGLEKIVAAGATLLVEIGPNPALTPAVATAFDAAKVQPIPTLKKDGKDYTNLLGALGLLYAKGVTLDLERLFWSPDYRRVSLPLYPFRKDRHWATPPGIMEDMPASPAEGQPDLPELHPLLGAVISRNRYRTVFQATLTTTSPWTDHRVLGSTVFPGTGYLDMAARGYAAIAGAQWRPLTLSDVAYERPLLLAYRKPKTVTLTLEHVRGYASEANFIIAAADNPAEVYCRGHLSPLKDGAPLEQDPPAQPDRAADVQIGPFYGELRQTGLEYGARFANVRELWYGAAGSGQALGRVSLAGAGAAAQTDAFTNAILLDGCLHVFGAALKMAQTNGYHGAYVPATIRTLTLSRELPAQVWSRVTFTPNPTGRAALADVRILGNSGEVLAEIKELELRQVESLSAGAASHPVSAASAGFIGLEAKTRADLIEYLRPLVKPQRIQALSKWLAAEIKDTMGQSAEGLDIESLPASTAFLEIGLDSLLVTELQRRIQEKLEFRFKPMQGLDYQSIESMAEYLHDEVLAPHLQTELVAGAA
jgi:acyl transferase domain-containing protein